ncbi:MAG: hypothetical protein WCG01_04210 [bacterium]
MIRILIHVLIVLIIFLLQVFISGLPGNLNSANIVLVSLIFYLVFDDINTLLYWLISLALLQESITYLPFGAMLISLSVSVFVAYLLLTSWLTNRSLYSLLILTWVVTIINNGVLYAYSAFINLVRDQSFMLNTELMPQRFFWSLLINSLLMLIIFNILNFINPRLKPFLLLKNR